MNTLLHRKLRNGFLVNGGLQPVQETHPDRTVRQAGAAKCAQLGLVFSGLQVRDRTALEQCLATTSFDRITTTLGSLCWIDPKPLCGLNFLIEDSHKLIACMAVN